MGSSATVEAPALNAINERLRVDYVRDSQRGVDRWNKIISAAGIDHRLTLPDAGFNRRIGVFANHHFSPAGEPLDEGAWQARLDQWMPSQADFEFVVSLMHPVTEPGKMANWITPPARGINGQRLDFEYVRFD